MHHMEDVDLSDQLIQYYPYTYTLQGSTVLTTSFYNVFSYNFFFKKMFLKSVFEVDIIKKIEE